MQISHAKLATAVKPGYTHSGKVDRDYGSKGKRNRPLKDKICRNVKKKQNRLLDKLDTDSDIEE